MNDREDVNDLLAPSQYAAMPTTRVPRDQWIPGYRCRVPRSTVQLSPWSSRPVSYTSVAELEVYFVIKHFTKPQYFLLPEYKDLKSSELRADDWATIDFLRADRVSVQSRTLKDSLDIGQADLLSSDWVV